MHIDNALLTALVTASRDNDTDTLHENLRTLVKATAVDGSNADMDTAIALIGQLDLTPGQSPAADTDDADESEADSDRVFLGDFLEERGYSRDYASQFGKAVKAAYVERHGRAPQTAETELDDGRLVPVAVYSPADVPLITDALESTPHRASWAR